MITARLYSGRMVDIKMLNKAYIRTVQSYFPSNKLTNEQLATEFADWSMDKIYSKTGIAERSLAGEDECASDLGVEAAKKLFTKGICKPEDIDFLIFCSQSPDYFLPATACIIQHRLQLKTSCGAIDVNQGCSGFVYGLSIAKGLIETGIAGSVLLITADTYSKFINSQDKSVRTIFGDGAAATLIAAMPLDRDLIGPFVLGTDGSGANELIVPIGAMRRPFDKNIAEEYEDKSGNIRSDHNLYMNGAEIFNFTLRAVPDLVNQLLSVADLRKEAVDYYIFHQANKFMLDTLRRKVKIPAGKFYMNMESCGNTVSSTVPIAMEMGFNEGVLGVGQRLMLVGFGVGFSWGATLIELTSSFSTEA